MKKWFIVQGGFSDELRTNDVLMMRWDGKVNVRMLSMKQRACQASFLRGELEEAIRNASMEKRRPIRACDEICGEHRFLVVEKYCTMGPNSPYIKLTLVAASGVVEVAFSEAEVLNLLEEIQSSAN